MNDFNLNDFQTEYNQKIELLKKKISAKKSFDEGIQLALDIHALTHSSVVSSSNCFTFFDTIISNLEESDYSVMPKETDETIAWHIWHITRIEDMVGNILINSKEQIFCKELQKKMNAIATDTGNAFSDEMIIDFSKTIDKKELLSYRDMVGKRGREIIASLSYDEIKGKASKENLERLLPLGCLTEEKDSIWLKDFWGRLTIGGMLCLPLTRHHMMHLPDSFRIMKYLHPDN